MLVAQAEDPLEGFPELRVEDGVDDRVHAGVDVPCIVYQQFLFYC